jgi:phosphatidylinositol kinase/protein kinase (PI-3  family)
MLPIYLRPYEIFVTSANSGLLEFIPDTNSIDYLKKKFPRSDWTLKTFFDKYFADDYETA